MIGKYIKVFDTHAEYQEYSQGNNMEKPNVSVCKNEHEVHYNPYIDYSSEYLTFVALEDGTFTFSTNAVSYSLDKGKTWTELAAATASPTVTAGNKIMWKGEMTPLMEESTIGVGNFTSTGRFDVQGNIMSLLYGDDFKEQTDLTEKEGVFANLFKLVWIGILLEMIILLFQLVTLPCEFNASKRANKELIKLGLIDNSESRGTKTMLRAAAFTYVAGLFNSILNLLRLIFMFNNRRNKK